MGRIAGTHVLEKKIEDMEHICTSEDVCVLSSSRVYLSACIDYKHRRPEYCCHYNRIEFIRMFIKVHLKKGRCIGYITFANKIHLPIMVSIFSHDKCAVSEIFNFGFSEKKIALLISDGKARTES